MEDGDVTDWKRPVEKTGNGGKGTWDFHLDKVRPCAVNILPLGGSSFGKGVVNFCINANKVNKVAVPLALAVDTVRVGASVYEDYNNGTTRNTMETAASVAGGWGGGVAGAFGGAAAGTLILPGIGTVIGGIIGCLSGGVGGSLGASAAVDYIGDAVDYDVEERVCDVCRKKFKVLKYKGEKSQFCPKCSKHSGR